MKKFSLLFFIILAVTACQNKSTVNTDEDAVSVKAQVLEAETIDEFIGLLKQKPNINHVSIIGQQDFVIEDLGQDSVFVIYKIERCSGKDNCLDTLTAIFSKPKLNEQMIYL